MNMTISEAVKVSAPAQASSKTASLAAMAVGALFIYLIGFSHIEVVHNAAHDTRHSTAFPCH